MTLSHAMKRLSISSSPNTEDEDPSGDNFTCLTPITQFFATGRTVGWHLCVVLNCCLLFCHMPDQVPVSFKRFLLTRLFWFSQSQDFPGTTLPENCQLHLDFNDAAWTANLLHPGCNGTHDQRLIKGVLPPNAPPDEVSHLCLRPDCVGAPCSFVALVDCWTSAAHLFANLRWYSSCLRPGTHSSPFTVL